MILIYSSEMQSPLFSPTVEQGEGKYLITKLMKS